MMTLVVLSTQAELASATARGRSYCEMGEFVPCRLMVSLRAQATVPNKLHKLTWLIAQAYNTHRKA